MTNTVTRSAKAKPGGSRQIVESAIELTKRIRSGGWVSGDTRKSAASYWETIGRGRFDVKTPGKGGKSKP